MRKFVILIGDFEDDVLETNTSETPADAIKEYLGTDYEDFKNLYSAVEIQ